MKKQLLAAASIASIAFAGLAFAAPANALACGTPALLVNGAASLTWYSPTGDVLETVALGSGQGYGDIALSGDAQTVYGVQNDDPGNTVDVVDVATGAIKSTITLTGAAADIGSWDGAAIRPDGKLIIGSAASAKVFTVDTATGASTEFFDYTTLSGIVAGYTTGDFVTLDNGDEIALATLDAGAGNFFGVVRIHADGTGIVIGTLQNEAWGAGRVNASLQLAGADGVIREVPLTSLPEVAGVDTIVETIVVDSGEVESLWGAAGTQDSGTQTCAPALPNTGVNVGALGALAAGLGLAGAASVVIARRKRA